MAKNNLEIELLTRKVVGYSHYKNRVPVISRLYLKNNGEQPLENIAVVVESEPAVFLPFRTVIEVLPFDSTVEVDLSSLSLSPYFLSGIEKAERAAVTVRAEREGKTLEKKQANLVVLPFDEWKPEAEYVDLLAGYVKPRHPEVAKLRVRAQEILAKWKLPTEISGYEGCTKNNVRQIAAAYFSALQLLGFERIAEAEERDWEKPQHIRGFGEIVESRRATDLELALLCASCMENAGFHPVLVFGKAAVSCAVWLYDNCFMDSYNADSAQVKKYASEGVNNLSAFDLACLFSGKTLNFTGAEKKFRDEIDEANAFRFAVDVKRCRVGGIRPLPERVMTGRGAELLGESDTAIDEAPRDIAGGKILSVHSQASREKQWERRLLDLSLKNMLLHFRPSVNTLHIIAADLSETVEALSEKGAFSVCEMPPDIGGVLAKARNFDSKSQIKSLAELNSIELKNRRLRCFVEAPRMKTTLTNLYRRERTAIEEMGADPLYLAAAFLKWYEREDSQFPKYAPLVLVPVALSKKTGGKGFLLKLREDGLQLNTTLLEFLKQEFNIDLRGLDTVENFRVSDVVASVRNGVVNMKGWDVVEDVHLAIFSFTRFLMWSDIRYHMDEFSKNRLVKSLIENRLNFPPEEMTIREVDIDRDYQPRDMLLPIAADESQFAAAAAASEGKSFVLHGPPGTGKSQTITNMIANALAQGKRVLFVAEKMAALSVVKQRLDSIGIGDFCLELHSNKADKTEICERLLSTLDSARPKEDREFEETGLRLAALRGQLNAPVEALHKKHYLGVSVYEAVLKYLESASAPDVMEIDSTFLDNLSADSLSEYETVLSDLAASAKECGEVYRSPFNDMAVGEYSERLRARLVTGSRILREEIRHTRAYLDHVLELFGHRVRTLTRRKIEALAELSAMLTSPGSVYETLFCAREGADMSAMLNDFSALCAGLEEAEKSYLRDFRVLVELPSSPKELRADLAGREPNKSRRVRALAKKLRKFSLRELTEAELNAKFDLILRIYEAQELISEQGEKISALLGGKRDTKQLEELAEKLNRLYAKAEEIFSEYDGPLFNDRVSRIYREDGLPVLRQFLRSREDFLRALSDFNAAFGISDDYDRLDDDYFEFLDEKCAALAENADLLQSWCGFYRTAEKLKKLGLNFTVEPLLSGALTSENLLACFRKKVFRYYIDTLTREDEVLSAFSGGQIEDRIEKYREACESFDRLTRKEILRRLASRIPSVDTEGSLSLEIVALQKTAKSGAHAFTLRKLFDDIPHLLPRLAPCMLMSPISVAQYISPTANLFDLVVFDEASQMPTAEAVGAIARGRSAVVVGDPKQLPPTSFFNTDYVDEENLEIEDLESILDDCLALGMPEKHLTWHYRSKHESLIAFSNIMYYGNKLNTFPSPDAMESKVTLRYVEDGVYDRGVTKQNKKEAEALVEEVRRRLSDRTLAKSSIGIVTFSTAQQVAVESLLSAMLVKQKLESAAYEREEPLFVKNLENVQGDERDVILFSVGYGPDRHGSLVLNFGPLNQSAGWRRLNVAVSRAREEMVVFSSMTSAMIDLSRTNAKGVIGLKKFLEFADKGRTMLAINSSEISAGREGIGKYIANELRAAGFECRDNVGVSGFKIDAAVCDPRNKKKFLLAILCDADCSASAKDRNILQVQTLKRLSWNVCRIWTLNFFNNPKREVKRVKDILERILESGRGKKQAKAADRYRREYKTANVKAENVTSEFLYRPENEQAILSRMQAIVDREEPLSRDFLIKRCLTSYGILRTGAKINARMRELAAKLPKSEELDGTTFYRRTDNCLKCDFYRPEGEGMQRREAEDLPPYELVAAMRSILEEKIALSAADLVRETAERMKLGKPSGELLSRLRFAVDYGVSRGILIRSTSDKITVA